MKLIICEKDNAAKRIASILSDDDMTVEKVGRVPVYRFMWEGEETCVMGLRGHIIELDFPKGMSSWEGTDPRSLIDARPVKNVSEHSIATKLKELSGEASSILVATDFDREGELIGSEAVEMALGDLEDKRVFRARFSSLTPDEVRSSFNKLTRLDLALANAAETRQVIDLVWGATLTRFISLASGRLGHAFLSVGRVQSPTLALLVDREKDIRAFEPVPYWRVEARFERDGITFDGTHLDGDIHDKVRAALLFSRVKGASEGMVTSVTKRNRTEKPPVPFNTTQFIRAANSSGYSAARIMSIAEDLYTRGFISYPRTDNTVYPKGLDLRKTLETLSQGPYRVHCEQLLSRETLVPSRGEKETTDHPPIYPTTFASKDELGPERFKIYDLVVRRFLATLNDPARIEITSLKIDVLGEPFSSSGSVLTYPGWRSVYDPGEKDEPPLPVLSMGDGLNVSDVSLSDKETKPPKRFSQGSLIQEMERLGLGTKSTRHEIIQKLIQRRFVEDNPTRPTLSGEALIGSLEKHAKHITEPVMTSRLEQDMERIAGGELAQSSVLMESREMLHSIMDVLEEHKAVIGSDINGALRSQDIVGKCPRCGNDLLVVRSMRGKRYVRCSKYPNCSRSYPLPQKGKVSFTSEQCPNCKSPMMMLYRRRGAPFATCMNMECPSRKQKDEAGATGGAPDV
ncbi:MAG: DNA topoisomerase I [Candidatus Thermoplasmatota archaeon]|jgi:DNA topoisomerase-1|nr:DNA topoisomerase I [Candidatus Thermoplasmatota archaeon]